MGINWKVRIKNKAFWVFLIPTALLLCQQVCAVFGVQIDVAGLSDQLVGIVGTVFAILALLGVAVDPTTSGVKDSHLAMSYEAPKEDAE